MAHGVTTTGLSISIRVKIMATKLIRVEYYSEAGSYEFFMMIEELMGVVCCLAPILSIVFLILGFSQGKPGMGWGGVSSLIAFPVMAIISLSIMW